MFYEILKIKKAITAEQKLNIGPTILWESFSINHFLFFFIIWLNTLQFISLVMNFYSIINFSIKILAFVDAKEKKNFTEIIYVSIIYSLLKKGNKVSF